MPRPNKGPKLRWVAPRQSYYVAWYDKGRERLRATGTSDRRQAEAALQAFIGASHRLADDGPREPNEIGVGDVLAIYGDGHAPTVKDPERIAHTITALTGYFGAMRLSAVTPSACRDYVAVRGVKPATARRELATLRAAINYAVKEQRLTRTVPVWLPQKPEGRDRWLTKNEAARLLNSARTGDAKQRLHLPLFILIALYTGARKEAILSLRWPQVDLERGRIDFKGGRAKTKKGRALLPMPERLLPFLRYAWQRRASDTGTVLHYDGRPVGSIKRSFATAVKNAGLADVTPHTLRHTCGTWLAQAGVDMFKIAGWLGQSHATTAELYSHHHPDFMDAAKRAADRRK